MSESCERTSEHFCLKRLSSDRVSCCVIRSVGQVNPLIGCVVVEGYLCRRLRLRPRLLALWLNGTE